MHKIISFIFLDLPFMLITSSKQRTRWIIFGYRFKFVFVMIILNCKTDKKAFSNYFIINSLC